MPTKPVNENAVSRRLREALCAFGRRVTHKPEKPIQFDAASKVASEGSTLDETHSLYSTETLPDDSDEIAMELLVAVLPRVSSAGPGRNSGNARVPKHMRYVAQGLLGKGAFGQVLKSEDKETGNTVAVKSVPYDMLKCKKSRKLVMDEITILTSLDHRCITKILDVYLSNNGVHLVLELADKGNALSLINTPRFNEEQAFNMFWQIVSAVEHCHSRDICHRDIKPENILIYEDGTAQLADFGLAAKMDSEGRCSTKCGTRGYAAPEVLTEKTYSGVKADIFSLGCLLFASYMKRLPFHGDTADIVKDKIKSGRVKFSPVTTLDFKDFFRGMTKWSPQERFTIAELKKHPFWVSRCNAFYLDPEGC